MFIYSEFEAARVDQILLENNNARLYSARMTMRADPACSEELERQAVFRADKIAHEWLALSYPTAC